MIKLNLPDVTLCAIDCVHPNLAARALHLSMAQCNFHTSLLLTDQHIYGAFETRTIEPLKSSAAYSKFVLKQLIDHVQTPYVLLVQWDGYVVDANYWRNNFLQYDYIGAVWPWDWIAEHQRVGNGGFSLRSKKLLQTTASDTFIYNDGEIEDVLIGQTHHDFLVQEHGIEFAPVDVANQFAYECLEPNQPTFGFHALFNIWRHNSDQQMIELIHALDDNILRGQSYTGLVAHYFKLKKFDVTLALYEKMKRGLGHDDMDNRLKHYIGDVIDINTYINCCESLLNHRHRQMGMNTLNARQ